MSSINSARMSLDALVARLNTLRTSKQDFVAPLHKFSLIPYDDCLRLSPAVEGSDPSNFGHSKPLTEKALTQLGERTPITVPSRFIREMNANASYRGALADVFNSLLPDMPGRNMIRCLDGRVRAFLSDKYRILDHWDAAVCALDVARAHDAYPIECSLTDSHMRIKFTTKRVSDMIRCAKHGGPSENYLRSIAPALMDDKHGVGGNKFGQGADNYDKGVVHPMVLITNSETGDGGFTVSEGIFDPMCRNGAVIEKSLRAIHIGGRLDEGLLKEDTIMADARATMMKARDILTFAFNPERFKAIMLKVHEAAGMAIAKPIEAIEKVVSDLGLSEDDSNSILSHFMDYDATRFGLSSAVSRYAQDVTDPEKAAALEAHAGILLTA